MTQKSGRAEVCECATAEQINLCLALFSSFYVSRPPKQLTRQLALSQSRAAAGTHKKTKPNQFLPVLTEPTTNAYQIQVTNQF